ncbi:hypothetical protein D3C73_918020 [compost metagenome]
MKPAREVFKLHALEIIYLTALTGGTSFPGVDIDLKGESERSLRSLMDAQMRSLEAKGYLEVDFMGHAQVHEILHSFIGIASSCTAYLCQVIHRKQQSAKVYYFFREGVCYELEHQPDSSIYLLQEIYAQHELMFQVVNRTPLVLGLNDYRQLLLEDHESDIGEWVEQSLSAGAAVLSLAEIRRTGEEAQAERELNLLIYDEQMWLLQRGMDEQITRVPVTFTAAVEELIGWLQVTDLSGGAEHVNSINDLSI